MRLAWRRAVIPLAAVGVLTAVILLAVGRKPIQASPARERRWPPLPHRVTVEVLNAGRVSGGSRVATEWLRQAGLDVVYFGNADSSTIRTVVKQHPGVPAATILMRTGDSTGTGRAARVLGGAPVLDAPDPTRLVDLTVVLGDSFSIHRPVP